MKRTAGRGGPLDRLRRVHWIVWAILAPTVIMGLGRLSAGCGQRVYVVGAGSLAAIREDDAPDGTFYELEVVEREPVTVTRERIEEALTVWPDVIVFGFDGRVLAGGEEAEQEIIRAYTTLTQRAENAGAVPIVVGLTAPPGADESLRASVERSRTWWQTELCEEDGLRICLDLGPQAGDAAAIRNAVASAVEEGVALHETLPDVGH